MAYWGLNDGLTVSVVYPHLEMLQAKEEVSKIVFVTVERDGVEKKLDQTRFNEKVSHQPLYSKNYPLGLLNKVSDFVIFPKELRKLLKNNKVDIAFTHGMVSGSLMHLTCPKLEIPYFVFAEPHSEYMLEAGVWKKQDPRYIYQKKWEHGQLLTASGIFSVTENYVNRIKKEYNREVSKKTRFAPNAVDLDLFSFNDSKRQEIRTRLGLNDQDLVGIYVGKFGGIYLEDQAFEIFKSGKKIIPSLKLIILTPQDKEEVLSMAKRADFGGDIDVMKVPHHEVKDYLFAADFGISVQNPKPSNLFLCPLKNGEYWAAGLPILSIDDVGDDTRRIKENPSLGAVFTLEDQASIEHAFDQIKKLAENRVDRIANEPRKAAVGFKNVQSVEEIFKDVLRDFG